MNHLVAKLLLVLLIASLGFSMFALTQGKFTEALMVYPLLVVVWVFTRFSGKGAK